MNTIGDKTNAVRIKPIFNRDFVDGVRSIENKAKDINIYQIDSGSEKDIRDFQDVLEAASDVFFGEDLHYEFQVHEKTGTIMSKLVNTDTGEIVREIPSEKILDMIAGLCEIAGVIIDDHA